ncbi:enoyl-CoA hydratase/isomerase family protein [Streptacidiphilus monticola]|uniref:Enoyl-CoA hydratase/isomerase family protein n=1 Tax=Streptacidiphilus monticola TaxID=2161674 RepID=A0ABW1GAN3_9ACTN
MSTWSVERLGAVAVLGFTRPPDNYMDFASVIALGDLLEGLAQDSEQVKVVMVTGGPDDRFIDHAELADLARASAGQASEEELGAWPRALQLLEEIPQPTIAAIDGLASGGGNELALACTLRVASTRARFQQPEITAGFIPGGGGSVRLPRLVGLGHAAEVVLTGREFSADEALRSGWVNAVLSAEDFRTEALQWVEAVARNAGPALFAAKRSIVTGSRLPFPEATGLERQLFSGLRPGTGADASS